MELTRIIHPIGQGGFYTETLKYDNEEVNVVYDCGGFYDKFYAKTISKTKMEQYLQKNYSKNEIDAVFISHFDWDHINGLEYLLNNYTVKYLFLPKLEEEEIIEVLASNLSKVSIYGNKRFYDFIIKLIYGEYPQSDSLKIVFVSHYDNNTIEENGVNINSLSTGIKIPTGTKLCFFNKWMYIPYNPSKKSKVINGETFYDCFIREIGDISSKDFPKKIKGNVERCKKIYRIFFGKHNAYSMTLFSGRLNLASNSPVNDCSFKCNRCEIELTSPNCLFTGDFESNVTEMKNFYNTKQLWNSIQTIQVPHHGSKDNYSPDLYDCASCGFMSFGTKNQWKHPDKNTLLSISIAGCLPLMVTEVPKTRKEFHYLE